MMEIQLKIEKKSQILHNLTFEHWLYAVIGGCAIQALAQYFTVKKRPWDTESELMLLDDPAFYICLMLTMLIALLIIRKWKRINPM